MTDQSTVRVLFTDLTCIEDLTRREFLASSLAAALLIACGDDDDEDGGGSATRDFTDSTGKTVKVPSRPQRIVAPTAPHWAAAQVLSLGFPVLAMSSWEGDWPPDYMTNYFETGEIDGIGWAEETDIEAVIALQPDLIVCSATNGKNDLDPTVLSRLEAVAPVVAIDPKRQVEDVMADYLRLLDADAQVLERQKAEFEGIMDQIEDVIGDGWKDVTVSSLWPGEDVLQAWGPEDLAMNAIVSRLGVKWSAPSAQAAEEEFGFVDLSNERMADFECDLLLYGHVFGDLADKALYNQLEVVKAGQVIEFADFTYDGTHYPNYIACAKHILSALKGMAQPLKTDIV